MIFTNGNAQTKNNQLLDAYKVDFGFYIKATDTNNPSEVPMHVEQERMEKAGWKPLVVYAHPEYLYAEDILPNGDETIWQIKYKIKRLMELRGKMALPMNFDELMKTNVYLTDEGFPERWKKHGGTTLTNDTITVAGHLCKRAVINYTPDAVRPGDTKLETTVWYCPELPRFYLPSFEYLQKIPGMALLVYSDRGHGEIKGIVAKNVVKLKKPASFYQLPKGTFIMYPPEII